MVAIDDGLDGLPEIAGGAEALNRVWGVTRNRSYLMNQLISLGLAAGIGAIALLSIAITAAQRSVLRFLFFGHINNAGFVFLSHWLLQISAAGASVVLFFLIYWVLPNRKLPIRAVLPTAIVVGLSWELESVRVCTNRASAPSAISGLPRHADSASPAPAAPS